MKRQIFSTVPVFKTLTILFVTSLCLLSKVSAQTADNSGFIHMAGTNGEEYNALKIKFEATINADQNVTVSNELNKYPGIKSIEFEGGQYMLIKFTNEISANQILAVLDKVNHPGHYLNSGVPVYYQKDQFIYYIR